MKIPALLIAAMLCTEATGTVTTTVVDVPSGAATQRFLYVRPDAPKANIIYLPGGTGILAIQDDGTMSTVPAKCGPVSRQPGTFADRGFAVALVDATTDGDVGQFNDVREVIRYMQERDNVPTWLIGGSSSTGSAMDVANNLPGDSPVGVIIYSPNPIFPTIAALVKRPIQIVYHPLDTLQLSAQLSASLTSATIKVRAALTGGTSAGCGYHTFAGLDAEFVATTTGFIDQYNDSLTPTTGTVTVVEYHHASFDHYFITPVAAEIALLDAHAPPFQEWSRTGFSFSAYVNATAPAASVPICRFFNVSFAPKSSHFYAAHGFGCEATISLFPDWGLEADKLFNTMLPDATGACPPGTIPVYRLYNNGMGAAPNHRFVTSLAERQKMLDQGFAAEGSGIGVGMCAPGP